MRRSSRVLLCGTALWLSALAAFGQFPQYTTPGSFSETGESTKVRLESGYEEALWNLGGLRLEPIFSVRNASYVDNVFGAPDGSEKVSDYTVTVTAGLFSYVHLGPKVILSGYLRPEYVWWQELDPLRAENVNGGLGVFGFFNRLVASVNADHAEEQTLLNNESEVPVGLRRDSARAEVELELNRRLYLLGSASVAELRYEAAGIEDLAALSESFLDRDEELIRVGLEFRITEGLRVHLGVEESEADFLDDPGGRSNTGTSPFVNVVFSRDKWSADIALVDRSQEFVEGSEQGELTATTGDARFSWEATERSTFTVYGSRSLIYSGVSADQLYLFERQGASYTWRTSARLSFTVFGERSENDFSAVSTPSIDRLDELEAVGGSLEFPLWRKTSFRLGLVQSKLESTDPALNRSTASLIASIDLSDNLTPW